MYACMYVCIYVSIRTVVRTTNGPGDRALRDPKPVSHLCELEHLNSCIQTNGVDDTHVWND